MIGHSNQTERPTLLNFRKGPNAVVRREVEVKSKKQSVRALHPYPENRTPDTAHRLTELH